MFNHVNLSFLSRAFIVEHQLYRGWVKSHYAWNKTIFFPFPLQSSVVLTWKMSNRKVSYPSWPLSCTVLDATMLYLYYKSFKFTKNYKGDITCEPLYKMMRHFRFIFNTVHFLVCRRIPGDSLLMSFENSWSFSKRIQFMYCLSSAEPFF